MSIYEKVAVYLVDEYFRSFGSRRAILMLHDCGCPAYQIVDVFNFDEDEVKSALKDEKNVNWGYME